MNEQLEIVLGEVEAAKREEQQASDLRKSASKRRSEAEQRLADMAKKLHAALGVDFSHYFTGKMVELSGWKPPVQVPVS